MSIIFKSVEKYHLACPSCDKGTIPIWEDGETILNVATDTGDIPCDYALVVGTCHLCGKKAWGIMACFAVKRLLETNIITRMRFNCDPGDEELFLCSFDENNKFETHFFQKLIWQCVEYKIKNVDPFQLHVFGPFCLLSESAASPWEGFVDNPFDQAREILESIWDQCVLSAIKRDIC